MLSWHLKWCSQTTIAQERKDKQTADAKAHRGAGGESPGCMWGEAGANKETCGTRFKRSCSQVIIGMEIQGMD